MERTDGLLDLAPDAPDWFIRAVACRPESRFVTVADTPIHYLRWGDPARPGLLFVHGNAAHAHWWSFLAPFFTDEFHVAAMDLSGMGDSGWRKDGGYNVALYAEEQIAVCTDAGMFSAATGPLIVGHSFGGMVASQAAAMLGERLSGLVMLDTPAHRRRKSHDSGSARGTTTYRTIEEALARFTLMPPQPCENGFLVDWVARRGLKRMTAAGGMPAYGWKFDPVIWRHFEVVDNAALIRASTCPMAVFYGEESALMDADALAITRDRLGEAAEVTAIPRAHHHVMLDQPLALVSALRTQIERWKLRRNAAPHV